MKTVRDILEQAIFTAYINISGAKTLTKGDKYYINTATDQALKETHDLIVGGKPNKPFQVSKNQKPKLKSITEIGLAGELIQTTSEDEDITYSEQDVEDAAYECAKPYLDAFEANLLKRLK